MDCVELFAGIGGFRIACDHMDLNTIWVNDIDVKACRVYRSNFGEKSITLGDIRNLKGEVPRHDLLTGGFPCQPFSSAGKKQGIRDARGTLFQEIVDILSCHRPKFFVLENVKRLLSMENGFHFATILDSLTSLGYRLEWRVLNAKDFGLPQNRERVVIGGIYNPENIYEFYLLSKSNLEQIPSNIKSKIVARNLLEISSHSRKFCDWGFAFDGKFLDCDLSKSYSFDSKVCLENFLQKKDEVEDFFYYTQDTIERIKKSVKVQKFINGVEVMYNQGGGARMGYTIFGVKGLAPTLTASTSRHYERYQIGNEFRRLTNVEYARIQGFSDHHCKVVSVYDQYALFGNAVPPNIVEWVIERLIKGVASRLDYLPCVQMELF